MVELEQIQPVLWDKKQKRKEITEELEGLKLQIMVIDEDIE